MDHLLLRQIPQEHVAGLGADDVGAVCRDGGVRHDGAMGAGGERLHETPRVEAPHTDAVARRCSADVCVRRKVELFDRFLVPVDRIGLLPDVVHVPYLDRFVDRRGDRFVQFADAQQRHDSAEVYVESLHQVSVAYLPHVHVLADGADHVLVIACEGRETAQLVLTRDVPYAGRQLELRERATSVCALLRHVPQLVAERQRREKVRLVVR